MDAALERQKDVQKLGEWSFEIGLWIGMAATPNRMGRKGDTHATDCRKDAAHDPTHVTDGLPQRAWDSLSSLLVIELLELSSQLDQKLGSMPQGFIQLPGESLKQSAQMPVPSNQAALVSEFDVLGLRLSRPMHLGLPDCAVESVF